MRRRLLLVGTCLLLACGDPMGPENNKNNNNQGPAVAAVNVSSPIGALIAVGRSAALTAQPVDAAGQAHQASVAWATTDPGIAQVTTSGVVTGMGPGSTTITATADGVNGTLGLTVASANLAGIQSLLDDPFADVLLGGIGGSTEASLRATWTACAVGRASGNLTALGDCVSQARAGLSGNTDQTKRPLVALVGLLVDWIDRHLNLP